MRVISLVTAFALFTSNTHAEDDAIAMATAAASNPCDTNGLLTLKPFYSDTFSNDMCTCDFENGLTDVNIDQQQFEGTTAQTLDFGAIVDVVNKLLQGLNYDYSKACSKTCECIGTACGSISASETIDVQGNKDANLTQAEVLGLLIPLQQALNDPDSTGEDLVTAGTSNITALATLLGPNLSTQNKIEYSITFDAESSPNYSGMASLTIDSKVDGIVTEFNTQPQDCVLQYNGQSCSSCEFKALENDKNCVTADCTGVDGVKSMVDTCAKTGLVGPFQFLNNDKTPKACGAAVSLCEGTDCEDDKPAGGDDEPASGVSSSSLTTAVAGVASLAALML